MTALLSLAARIALLAIFTFGFLVLFEYGPASCRAGARAEWKHLVNWSGQFLPMGGSAAEKPLQSASPTPSSSLELPTDASTEPGRADPRPAPATSPTPP